MFASPKNLSGRLIFLLLGLLGSASALALGITPARIFNPYLLVMSVLLLLAAAVAAYIFRINQRLSRNLARLHEAQDSQMQSEALFRTLSDTAAAGIYVLHGSRFSMANASMSSLSGYSLEELLTMDFADFIHPDDLTMVNRRTVMRRPNETLVSRYQFRIITKNGGMRWVELTSGRVMLNGESSVVGTVYDISEHRQLEGALQQSQSLYQSILVALPDAVVVSDLQGIIEHISPAGLSMLRAKCEADLLGRNIGEFRDPEEEARAIANIAGMFEGRYSGAEEYRVIRLDGSVLETEINAEIIRDANGQPSGLIFVVRDISERRKTEQRIRHMAQHDTLTGLANRALFADRMQRALVNAQRDQTPLALMFLDLDKFKPINDSYGHAVGDLLLQQVAQRIQACVRESDTVARIGGDEFVVLLRCITHTGDVLNVAEKIRNSLCQPFTLAGHQLEISSSIGVAIYPEHGTDDLTLSKNADHAMYVAKEAGRNRVSLFTPKPEPVAGALIH